MLRTPPTTTLLRTVAAAFVVLACAVQGAAAAPAGVPARSDDTSVGFGVEPLRFDLSTPPGTSSTHTITITNTTTSATRYTFSKEDFSGDRDDPGATPVLLGGKFESAISGFDWVKLPDPVSVPAGASRNVRVNVVVPSGATGGHYAALMVHGESRSANQIIATSRIGVLFSMNAGGVPPPQIIITEIQEVGPTRTVTRFVNGGSTTIKKPGGTITRKPLGGGGSKRVVTGTCTGNVLPGAAGECAFEEKERGKGRGILGGGSDGAVGGVGPVERYVDIVGDPGDEETAVRSELPTEWAGTWTSLLLPLVGIALFVLYFLFLRRRRKGGQVDDEDDADLAWAGPDA